MGEAYRMGLMHGQFDSMTQGERMELRTVRRLVRRIEEQLRLLVLTGTTWPEQAEPVRLRWPDVPKARKVTRIPEGRQRRVRKCTWDNERGYRLFQLGLTSGQIAGELGTTAKAVQQRRRKYWNHGRA